MKMVGSVWCPTAILWGLIINSHMWSDTPQMVMEIITVQVISRRGDYDQHYNCFKEMLLVYDWIAITIDWLL